MNRFTRLASILGLAMLTLPVAVRPGPAAGSGFSAQRAYANVKKLVEFGPRPSGSSGLKKARHWLKVQLARAGCEVVESRFMASTPAGPIPMANLIGQIPGRERKVVILAAHYESKNFPEFRFVGANDSASGTALVLELAGVLAAKKNRFTYWMVLFDGEEAIGDNWSDADGLYGSKHMVRRLTAQGELARIHAVFLLDMIGDAQLRILRDENSTPWLTDLAWRTAKNLGYGRYFSDRRIAIEDDHRPFVMAGVSAIDLIDFDYGPGHSYWHSPRDTIDKISARSLGIVGRVVLASLQQIESGRGNE